MAPFGLRVETRSSTEYHLLWERNRDAKIYRSTEQSSGYSQIAQPSNASQYIDEPTTRPRSRTDYYYKVHLFDSEGNKTNELGPEKAAPHPSDKGALYIRRQARRHLKRIGQKSYLFESADSGKRCPECWDEERQMRTRKDCDNCEGTGYVNGWSDPIKLYMSYSLEQIEPKQTQGGKLNTQQVNAHTAASPRISMGDHIVRKRDRQVYEVLKQQPSKKSEHILRQNVIIKMVEKGSAARQLADKIPT